MVLVVALVVVVMVAVGVGMLEDSVCFSFDFFFGLPAGKKSKGHAKWPSETFCLLEIFFFFWDRFLLFFCCENFV